MPESMDTIPLWGNRPVRWAPAGREGLAQRQTNLFEIEIRSRARSSLSSPFKSCFTLPLSTHDLLRRAVEWGQRPRYWSVGTRLRDRVLHEAGLAQYVGLDAARRG